MKSATTVQSVEWSSFLADKQPGGFVLASSFLFSVRKVYYICKENPGMALRESELGQD